LEKKLTEALICFGGKEVAAEFKMFVLSTLEKHQHFLHKGPWPATYDPRELNLLIPETSTQTFLGPQ